MALDYFGRYLAAPASPAADGVAITPSDTEDLTVVTRGLYLGTAGDAVVTLVGGTTLTFKNLAAGIIHPLRVVRVWSTGTTATDLVGVM